MARVQLTIVESKCRGDYHKTGDCFIVDDLCPPICHELWNCAYPMIYALQNGGILDYGSGKAYEFDVLCPDGGRVKIHGVRIDD